jgi:predicted glycogen debranching enzyme
MIIIPREICIDLDRALDKEWLVANGLGGYASSTITGANTRRYHGLLVAALRPPVERTVLLAKIDEEVQVGDRIYYLGTNEYPNGKIHPDGFVFIEEFRICEGIPTTIFRMGDVVLHKSVWMEYGHNTTYVRYHHVGGIEECLLTLHPMCTYRDYHSMLQGSFDRGMAVEPVEEGCKVTAHEGALPYWLVVHPHAEFTPTGVWYWNFVYRREIERGFDEREDLYVPGVFRATLAPGHSLTLVASIEPPDTPHLPVNGALDRAKRRWRGLLEAAGISPQMDSYDAASPATPVEAFAAQLVLAADSFIVRRRVSRENEEDEGKGGSTSQPGWVPAVLAGYHWFTDWGRDTMISLPGLMLPSGRTREANQILRAFAMFVRDGLIPNRFPDVGDMPEYNTADATLWMFAIVDRLAASTGSLSTARELYPLLSDIIATHVRGTRFGIGMDPADGLLYAGEQGVQLTWMDARVDDWVVTPRTGKPVEINALWHNALCVMDRLSAALAGEVVPGKEEAPDFGALARRAATSFRERFWYEPGGYLYDVIDGPQGDDPSLRPNQLLALSSGKGLLTPEQAARVLAVVRKYLLTPYGLRTLSPDDPGYRPRIIGSPRERDAAYHNGTVWAWLLGPYLDAVRNTQGESAARAELQTLLPALRRHLADAGLGTISEIFDGDPPHTPRGCISQAWSVAEVLRQVWGPDRLL